VRSVPTHERARACSGWRSSELGALARSRRNQACASWRATTALVLAAAPASLCLCHGCSNRIDHVAVTPRRSTNCALGTTGRGTTSRSPGLASPQDDKHEYAVRSLPAACRNSCLLRCRRRQGLGWSNSPPARSRPAGGSGRPAQRSGQRTPAWSRVRVGESMHGMVAGVGYVPVIAIARQDQSRFREAGRDAGAG